MSDVYYQGSHYPDFITYLNDQQIKYNQRRQLSEAVAIEMIQVLIGSGGAGWVAKCFVDWLKSRRQASIFIKDGDKEIRLENVTEKTIRKLLEENKTFRIHDE